MIRPLFEDLRGRFLQLESHMVVESLPAFIPIDTSRQSDRGLVVRIEVETNSRAVTVYPASNGAPLTGAFVFPITKARQTVFIFAPIGTHGLVFQNATSLTSPGVLKILKMDYASFADLSDIVYAPYVEMVRKAEACVFIHTPGKTGSVSLQNMLDPLASVVVARDHFVNLPRISAAEDNPASSVLKMLSPPQLTSCRVAMYALEQAASNRGSFEVVTGVRRFDSQIMAMAFQTLGAQFLKLKLSPDNILKFIFQNSDSMALLDFWWQQEFFETHGFSFDELARDVDRNEWTWTYKSPRGILHRFYRIEDGDPAFRECLKPYARYSPDPDAYLKNVVRSNVGAEKPYSDLYQAVKDKVEAERLLELRSPLIQKIEGLFYQ